MAVHAGGVGGGDVLSEGVRGHGDDRNRPTIRAVGHAADRLGRFVAVLLRHHDVHEDEVVASGRRGAELVDDVLAVDGTGDLHALLLEECDRDLGVQVVVLRYQYTDALQVALRTVCLLLLLRHDVCDLKRQLDGEGRADALLTLHMDLAVHHVDVALRDGHTEARTLIVRAGTVTLL